MAIPTPTRADTVPMCNACTSEVGVSRMPVMGCIVGVLDGSDDDREVVGHHDGLIDGIDDREVVGDHDGLTNGGVDGAHVGIPDGFAVRVKVGVHVGIGKGALVG